MFHVFAKVNRGWVRCELNLYFAIRFDTTTLCAWEQIVVMRLWQANPETRLGTQGQAMAVKDAWYMLSSDGELRATGKEDTCKKAKTGTNW